MRKKKNREKRPPETQTKSVSGDELWEVGASAEGAPPSGRKKNFWLLTVSVLAVALFGVTIVLIGGYIARTGLPLDNDDGPPPVEDTLPPVGETPPPEEDTPPPTPAETVNLIFYVLGDPPADQQMVENAINERLLEKCNATITFKFTSWTDHRPEYANMLLAQEADLCYTALWLNYDVQANAGAFLPLDDLLDQYAPDLRARCGEALLDQCRVNGNIYCVPGLWPEYVSPGILYREDLRQEYGLPVPDSLDNMEAYFKGVRDNQPEQTILWATTEDSYGFSIAFDAAWVLNLKYPWTAPGGGMPYGLASDYSTPDQLYDYWYSQDFIDDCKMFKRWADMGFWSRSALYEMRDEDAFRDGGCVAQIAGQYPYKYAAAAQQLSEQHPDWQAAYYAYGETTGVLYPNHATQNGTAILLNCRHPDAAIRVLQALMTDEELNRLVLYGIQGIHYQIIDGVYNNDVQRYDPKPFDHEGFNAWNLRNADFMIPGPADTVLRPMFDKYAAIGSQTKWPNINIWDGFQEDWVEYYIERNAVKDVMTEYLAPIQAGLVYDVEAAVAEFLQKAEAAGLGKCREGFRAQWEAYCNEYGYQ